MHEPPAPTTTSIAQNLADEDAFAWAVASSAAEKALEVEADEGSEAGSPHATSEMEIFPKFGRLLPSPTRAPPPPPLQAPNLSVAAALAQPSVQHPRGLDFMAMLTVPPPPSQSPTIGAKMPFLLQPPSQEIPQLLAKTRSLQPASAPPMQPPVLSAQIHMPSVSPPPAQAPVFPAQAVQLLAPPANAPVMRMQTQDSHVAPPPSHAPVLRLVDAVPAPELGSAALPTVGSEGHNLGTCRPCAFMYTKGCGNGVQCIYCHLCKPGEKKRRMQEKRQQLRDLQRALNTFC